MSREVDAVLFDVAETLEELAKLLRRDNQNTKELYIFLTRDIEQ